MAAGKRPRKEEQVIAALLTEPTIEAAATSCGIGERTLRRWLARPEFAAAYAEARREALRRGIGCLVAALPDAVNAVREVMRYPTAPGASVKVSAARVLIAGWPSAHEADGLEERIAALEARLAGQGAPS